LVGAFVGLAVASSEGFGALDWRGIAFALAGAAGVAGIALFALLASRVRRGWQRRRDARLRRRSSGGHVTGVPSPQQ